ncbi:MAG: flagellar basal body rod protein FlgC, partial [Candidatus Zixiibacteriota bacterium]
NIANAETTRTREGGPYRRKKVVVTEEPVRSGFSSMVKEAGLRLVRTSERHLKSRAHPTQSSVEIPAVKGEEVADHPSSYRLVYDPSHPDADAEGYVKMPDIEVVTEMVDMMAASRAYEANTVAITAAKKMAKDALDI